MNLLTIGLFKVKTAILGIILCLLTFQTFAQIKKVRLDYHSPNGAVRQILLGFTPNNEASDGFDYGYDAASWTNHDYDMNWIIEDYRYLIQGVGVFEDTKTYPIGIFLAETSEVHISLNSLENFEEDIEVFIHDTLDDTYTLINESSFLKTIEAGDYMDRFYIAFKNPNINQGTLGTDDFKISSESIRYIKEDQSIILSGSKNLDIQDLVIYDINGKQIFAKQNINDSRLSIEHLQLSHSPYIIRLVTDYGHISRIIYI
ncbi:hypothetical protein Q2T40_09160 [Winogradskyella maritima]|uniref:Secreted protein (Por secretion system target) n=1 Tax=Winogradskyella maritima TaxID=1517766 RepID=A0ABV8AFG2_9FLAO|nr:hypothetical protein [Winogradskyella maritima]